MPGITNHCRKRISLWLLAILLFSFNLSYANRTITGNVKDENNEPIVGATITIPGTNIAAFSNEKGSFSITAPNGPITIKVSSVSYETQTIALTQTQTTVDIILKEANNSLDELVVIGYGTIKKKDLTGAVATIKGEELTAYVVPDPIMALQGRTPGVQISQNTGAPDGDFTVRIRGVNSIKGDNAPLYIVDGVPFSNYTVNPYDIESLEVLKDASATAIYGSRGANGVILITTKRGKSGKSSINYNFDYGVQTPVNSLDLMNSQEWAQFYNEYLVNAKILETPAFTPQEISEMGKGTDWQKTMLKNAAIQNHNLSFSGGADKVRYHISGSAMLREGLIPNSSFDKYNLRSTLDFSPNKYLDGTLQMGYSLVDGMNQANGGGNGGSSMIGAIYSAAPTFPVFDEKGNYKDLRSFYSWSSHEIRNPLMMAKESTYKTVRNISNINGSLNFKPFAGLSLKTSIGIENSDSRYDGYTTRAFIYQNNTASVNHTRYNNITNENILNYNLTIDNNHSINAMGGVTYQEYSTRNLAASGNTFLSDWPKTNALNTAGIVNTPSTSFTKWTLLSYLGRLNYSFKSKYLVTASFRADGSSRYSPSQRWGYFPSGAVAWRVSEEDFMRDIKNISDLKIRASFGKTGSTAISPYSTQNLLFAGKAATGNGNYTYFAPGTVYPGDLKWETTAQYDIGFDLAMFDHKLRLTADYYHKSTTDLLNTVFLPTSSGYVSSTQNIGRMDNKGVELAIDGDIIKTNDFQFTAGFNISKNKNEVVKLSDGRDILGTTYTNYGSGAITIIREGEPLGAFYLFKDTGLSPTGQLTYEDKNGDGLYTDAEDRHIAGSPFPKFIYGMNLDVRYKNWALSALLQGSYGNKIFNLSEMRNYSYSQGMNIERDVYYSSWREGQDNSNAKYPKIEQVGPLRYSDRFLEDGSYLRLKNISLAYHIPVPKSMPWLKAASVYAAAQNYLTFTKYTGLDPEVNSKGGDIDGAIDHFTYPTTKTISFGAKIQF